MILKRKTMFDILKEADEDNDSTADTNTNTEEPAVNAGSSDNDNASDTSTDNNDGNDGSDTSTDDNFGGEDDFNIDTSLDDSGDDSDSDSSSNTDTGSSDTDNGESEEETPKEVIQTNANIFNSLTKEEQEIKIRELKKLFNELYSSTDDIVQKINNIPTDESNILTINRVSKTLVNTKEYIKDYLLYSFTSKSFIENDVMFNRFLVVLNSVSGIIDKMYNQNQ